MGTPAEFVHLDTMLFICLRCLLSFTSEAAVRIDVDWIISTKN